MTDSANSHAEADGLLQVSGIETAGFELTHDTELTVHIPTSAQWPDGSSKSLPRSSVDQLVHHVFKAISNMQEDIATTERNKLCSVGHLDPDPCPAGSQIIKDAVKDWHGLATAESISRTQPVPDADLAGGYNMPKVLRDYSFLPSTGRSGFSYKPFRATNGEDLSLPISLMHNEDEITPKMTLGDLSEQGNRDSVSGDFFVSIVPTIRLNNHCHRYLTAGEFQNLKAHLQQTISSKAINSRLSAGFGDLALEGEVSGNLERALKNGADEWLNMTNYTCLDLLDENGRIEPTLDEQVLELPALKQFRDTSLSDVLNAVDWKLNPPLMVKLLAKPSRSKTISLAKWTAGKGRHGRPKRSGHHF